MTIQLRQYQRDAIEAAVHAQRGIIQIGTGGGKSLVLAGLLSQFHGRWLILVPRRILRDQLYKTFESYGLRGLRDRVVVSTWQGYYKKWQNRDPRVASHLRNLEGICVDEAHSAAAPCLSSLLEAAAPPRRIGLSATPLLRPDEGNAWALQYFGKVVYRLDAADLVSSGHLTQPQIELVPTPRVHPHASGYAATVSHNVERNSCVADVVADCERPTLVLVNHVEHGQALLRHILDRRIRTKFVHGSTPDDERDAAIKALREGNLECLVATTIFDVGVDIPELRAVVVASGGKSAIACIQRLGRVLRLADGKRHANLVDFYDTGTETVENNTRQRIEAYRMAGFQVETPPGVYTATEQPEEGRQTETVQPPSLWSMLMTLFKVPFLILFVSYLLKWPLAGVLAVIVYWCLCLSKGPSPRRN